MSTGFQTDAFQLNAFQALAGDAAGAISGTASQAIIVTQVATGTAAQIVRQEPTGGSNPSRKSRHPKTTGGAWIAIDSEEAKKRLKRWAEIDAELDREQREREEAKRVIHKAESAAKSRREAEERQKAKETVERLERERIAAMPKIKGQAAQTIAIAGHATAIVTSTGSAQQHIQIAQSSEATAVDTMTSLRIERDRLKAQMAKLKRDNDALSVLLMAA
jgi:hypothetical protein